MAGSSAAGAAAGGSAQGGGSSAGGGSGAGGGSSTGGGSSAGGGSSPGGGSNAGGGAQPCVAQVSKLDALEDAGITGSLLAMVATGNTVHVALSSAGSLALAHRGRAFAPRLH